MAHVLIVCADRALSDALQVAFADQGCRPVRAADAESAALTARDAELVLWARSGPGGTRPRVPGALLALVAPRAPGAARAALEAGADALLPTPIDAGEVGLLLRLVAERGQQRRARRLQGRELRRALGDHPIVAASPAMIEVLETLERVAAMRGGVLLRGERGTGKEGLARALHAFSPRRHEPFAALQCAGADTRELESELFGRPAAGAHESARPGLLLDVHGGTLFLDDAHALPAPLQQRLAETLRSEELLRPGASKPERLDLRVLAATPLDLASEVAAGRFRRDLYECFAALELRVPPLRARALDLPLLIDHFVTHACRLLERPRLEVGEDALARLVSHAWPGNLRELERVVARAVAGADGDRLGAEELPDEIGAPAGPRGLALRPARKHFEVELIRRALRASGGNRTHAARLLHISHRALLYKLKEHGIE
jgi:two-component system response regulator AtoC